MRKRKKAALLVFAAFLAILAGTQGAGKTYAKEEDLQETESETESVETGRNGTVRIDYREKVDGTDPIAGAEFTFYRISDGEKSEAGRIRTDRNGNAEIVLPEGSYEVRETEPAAGHEASISFRLTIPMLDKEGHRAYVITAEPKPAKLPEETPVPSKPQTSSSAESVPERSASVPEQVRRTTEEVKKITTGTITREVKREIIKQKEKADKANRVQNVQPVRTSDSGDAVLYLMIAGSSVAVCCVMIWIRKKGEQNA